MTYAYMADEEQGICCLKGEILAGNICQKVTELDVIENCYSFDIEKKECLKCKQGF